MQGVIDDIIGKANFHYSTQVHNRNAIGKIACRRKIVGYIEVRQAKFFLYLLHHVKDLGSRGKVYHRDRLVCNQHHWVEYERSCRCDSLALSSGKHVRPSTHKIIGRRQLDLFKGSDNHGIALFDGRLDLMDDERLLQHIPNLETRIHRSVGVLKDHLNFSTVIFELFFVEVRHIFAVKNYLS